MNFISFSDPFFFESPHDEEKVACQVAVNIELDPATPGGSPQRTSVSAVGHVELHGPNGPATELQVDIADSELLSPDKRAQLNELINRKGPGLVRACAAEIEQVLEQNRRQREANAAAGRDGAAPGRDTTGDGTDGGAVL